MILTRRRSLRLPYRAQAGALLGEVGASLDGTGPGHVAAEETKRRGMKPLYFFLLLLFD